MSSSLLACRTAGSSPVFALEGVVVERSTVAELQRRVGSALADGQGVIVIDLLGVRVMSTQVLSKFCAALRQASGSGARLPIVGADPRVWRVLELCEIEGLELHPTVNAAVASREMHPNRSRRRGWQALLARWGPAHPGPDSGAPQ